MIFVRVKNKRDKNQQKIVGGKIRQTNCDFRGEMEMNYNAYHQSLDKPQKHASRKGWPICADYTWKWGKVAHLWIPIPHPKLIEPPTQKRSPTNRSKLQLQKSAFWIFQTSNIKNNMDWNIKNFQNGRKMLAWKVIFELFFDFFELQWNPFQKE